MCGNDFFLVCCNNKICHKVVYILAKCILDAIAPLLLHWHRLLLFMYPHDTSQMEIVSHFGNTDCKELFFPAIFAHIFIVGVNLALQTEWILAWD